MKREILDEVLACLPEERRLFHYFKGQYAFTLLSYAVQIQTSVGALKRSPFQRLLNQSGIKALLAQVGNGNLSPDLFSYPWSESSEPFVLTLDRWSGTDRWSDQVSRSGGNLVLQLNFSEKHNRAYRKLVKPNDNFIFNYQGHPVMSARRSDKFRDTLAWARLDVDLESGEVLIEEVQSDWVRRVKRCVEAIHLGRLTWHLNYCDCKPEAFVTYAEQVFAPFIKLWSEAMLMASITFIYAELGIRTIYYHTYETGSDVKRIWGKPPRSLYSDLPRKFCFRRTDEDPLFLQSDRSFKRRKRKLKEISWYKLEL